MELNRMIPMAAKGGGGLEMIKMTDLCQKKYIRNYQVSFHLFFCDVMAKSFEAETSVSTHVTHKNI